MSSETNFLCPDADIGSPRGSGPERPATPRPGAGAGVTPNTMAPEGILHTASAADLALLEAFLRFRRQEAANTSTAGPSGPADRTPCGRAGGSEEGRSREPETQRPLPPTAFEGPQQPTPIDLSTPQTGRIPLPLHRVTEGETSEEEPLEVEDEDEDVDA